MPAPSARTDADRVAGYLAHLDHPLRDVLEALRALIQAAHPALSERIKWAAPSYHVQGQDLFTDSGSKWVISTFKILKIKLLKDCFNLFDPLPVYV
ncbi:MAG: DUF1801 domain-containing protein [Bacteroidia bacterium]|nr:DUF1801 domain-containing protein [Bacteroidia bacterium]